MNECSAHSHNNKKKNIFLLALQADNKSVNYEKWKQSTFNSKEGLNGKFKSGEKKNPRGYKLSHNSCE